jgi:hypothetical protein
MSINIAMFTKIFHQYSHHAKKTLYWLPADTEDKYQNNLTTQYQKLLDNYKEGLNLLIQNKDKDQKIRINYTIDFYWHKIQKKDNWYVVVPSLSVQRTDVSYINGSIRVMNKLVYM